MKNEGEKIFPRFARTDRRYAPLCTASGSVSYTVPPPFRNPVSAPALCGNIPVLLHQQGRDGRDGRDGLQGPIGSPGMKGEKGDQGTQLQGPPGQQGK